MEAPTVASLYRYPVKGLSPERLEAVDLAAGETLPLDRAYAIENGHGPGGFDPDQPRYLPKIHFLMLMRDERLATLETRLDADHVLTVLRGGKQVARGNLRMAIGRSLVEQFFAAYMKGSLRGAPRVVSATGHSFSDVAAKCVHVVNLASVRDLGRILGRPIDPLRFRANLYVDGVPPWQELGWLDKELVIGGAAMKVFKRTQRCDATNVDPATGVRDLSIPAALTRTWGHADFGVYARVAGAGRIALGDTVVVS